MLDEIGFVDVSIGEPVDTFGGSEGEDNHVDGNDGKDYAGRLWVSPWKGTPSSLAVSSPYS